MPTPGTRKMHRLQENLRAAAIKLTREDLRASKMKVQGARGTGQEKHS
jgi:aryl-alcohol dehydrogenase-like predicted oxidoreductase